MGVERRLASSASSVLPGNPPITSLPQPAMISAPSSAKQCDQIPADICAEQGKADAGGTGSSTDHALSNVSIANASDGLAIELPAEEVEETEEKAGEKNV